MCHAILILSVKRRTYAEVLFVQISSNFSKTIAIARHCRRVMQIGVLEICRIQAAQMQPGPVGDDQPHGAAAYHALAGQFADGLGHPFTGGPGPVCDFFMVGQVGDLCGPPKWCPAT